MTLGDTMLNLTCRRLAILPATLRHRLPETITTATREEARRLVKDLHLILHPASDTRSTLGPARDQGVPRLGLVMLTWIALHGELNACSDII